GVPMIEGGAWNEPLTIGEPPGAREYGPGETFWFPGEGIHRMDHQAGAVTIHVYSPRANVSAGGAGAGAPNGLPGRWRRAAARGAFIATIMRLPGPGQRAGRPATTIGRTHHDLGADSVDWRTAFSRAQSAGRAGRTSLRERAGSTDVAAAKDAATQVRKTNLYDSSAHRTCSWPAPGTSAHPAGGRGARPHVCVAWRAGATGRRAGRGGH